MMQGSVGTAETRTDPSRPGLPSRPFPPSCPPGPSSPGGPGGPGGPCWQEQQVAAGSELTTGAA